IHVWSQVTEARLRPSRAKAKRKTLLVCWCAEQRNNPVAVSQNAIVPSSWPVTQMVPPGAMAATVHADDIPARLAERHAETEPVSRKFTCGGALELAGAASCLDGFDDAPLVSGALDRVIKVI